MAKLSKTNQEPPTKEATSAPSLETKRQIAARFQKDERTIETWMRAGLIPYIKMGKGRRAPVLFDWEDVQAHIKARFGHGGV